MKSKNGFIATSVLYAFLIAFLTLFLGFMSAYIQNKQLINRIEEMAKDDLEKYGNTRISDMEIGDYVIFDTIDNVSNGLTTDVQYTAPIDPNTKWILFSIDKTSSESDDLYYFVSASDALKGGLLMTAINNIDPTTGPESHESLPKDFYTSNLSTLSKVLNGNVYYNAASQTFRSYDFTKTGITEDGNYKVFSYQFMYYLNGGIDVRLMNNKDIKDINNIDNIKIKHAIFRQNDKYTFWNIKDDDLGESGLPNEEGFYTLEVKNLNIDKPDYDSDESRYCSSSLGFKHIAKIVSSKEYYDYCYYPGSYIGTCYDSNPKCGGTTTQNPRFVATIKVSKNDVSTNGYIDSGNGTSMLPYLITKGVKK
ncbi:MAG: hypothetical protein IJS56_00900 [Bacilli bacterium]|nr:hypothetical protein [Bacilli bacterium]